MKLRKMNSRIGAIGIGLAVAASAVLGLATGGYAQVYRPGRAGTAVDPAEAAAYKAFATEGSPEAKIELG